MKLYKIDYDGPPDYVEAASFAEAIAKWRAYVVAHDDVDPGAEPESVALIADSRDHSENRPVVIR